MSGFIRPDRCATPDELVLVHTPFRTSKGAPISVQAHRAVAGRLRLALRRADRYSPAGRKDKINRIDSFSCRNIRGSTTTLSRHAAGAAWDMFLTDPNISPPGGVWTPENTYGATFAKCFTDLGFTWGKKWSREDDPHMEWSGDYVPPLTLRERIRTRRLAQQRAS